MVLPQVESYLRAQSSSCEGKMDCEIDKRIAAPSAVMPPVYCGEERAESKNKALNIMASLASMAMSFG